MGRIKKESEERKGEIAEESSKTQKTREKIKKQLARLDEQVSSKALEQKTIEIHRWIDRHSSQRVVLRSKSIALFDENQNAAKISKKVSAIVEQLRLDNPMESNLNNREIVQKNSRDPC